MKVGKRPLKTFLKRITEVESYAAFIRMLQLHDRPIEIAYKEIFSKGIYPTEIKIHTPIGEQKVRLYHYDDLSTLNLIFCRRDYYPLKKMDVVVDLGGNIGLSALFWLTRNTRSQVYVYEPVPRNYERLRLNLMGCEGRYEPYQLAVSDFRGQADFGLEDTGIKGGIDVSSSKKIKVDCIPIMDILDRVLKKHKVIDCLKIDIEGHEKKVLQAIDADCWKYIRSVNVEYMEAGNYIPDYFSSHHRVSAMYFENRNVP